MLTSWRSTKVTNPSTTRARLIWARSLCLANLPPMTRAERMAHYQAVAAVRAADDHKRSMTSQGRLEGV